MPRFEPQNLGNVVEDELPPRPNRILLDWPDVPVGELVIG